MSESEHEQQVVQLEDTMLKLRWALALLIPLVSAFWFGASHVSESNSNDRNHYQAIQELKVANNRLAGANTVLREQISKALSAQDINRERLEDLVQQERDARKTISEMNAKIDRLLGRMEAIHE